MDPFDFSQQSDAQVGAGQPNLLDRWGQALQNPATRAGLMQMGLQLMQPMGFGQSPMGHLAASVGAAGEASDRVDTENLKERVAQNTMDRTAETLRQGQERIAIGNRNATTRENALQLRAGGTSGLSMRDLVSGQRTEAKALETQAWREAQQAAKVVSDSAQYGLAIPPGYEKYSGKTAQDIYREKLADPTWRKGATVSRGVPTVNDPSQLPPVNQRVAGQTVVTTPKGNFVWNGKGWTPVQGRSAAPPADVMAPDDTEDQ